MKHLFSPRMRVSTWRQLWVWLMESQKELGLPITDEALNQMKVNQIVKDEEFAIAAKEEARRRYAIHHSPFSTFAFVYSYHGFSRPFHLSFCFFCPHRRLTFAHAFFLLPARKKEKT